MLFSKAMIRLANSLILLFVVCLFFTKTLLYNKTTIRKNVHDTSIQNAVDQGVITVNTTNFIYPESKYRSFYLKDLKAPHYIKEYKNPCWRTRLQNESFMCLPYVHIAGFPKCGTTDLHYRLTVHPLVNPAIKKETHFLSWGIYLPDNCSKTSLQAAMTSCKVYTYSHTFYQHAAEDVKDNIKHRNDWSTNRYSNKFRYAISGMERQFPDELREYREFALEQHPHPYIIVDGSPEVASENIRWGYIRENRGLDAPEVLTIDVMLTMTPNSKVILLLRDPVARSYSDYLYYTRGVASLQDFHDRVSRFVHEFSECTKVNSVNYCVLVRGRYLGFVPMCKSQLVLSVYYVYIQEILKRMPRENVLILRSEDYNSNLTKELEKVFAFLGFPPLGDTLMKAITEEEKRNKSVYKSAHGKMWKKTEEILQEFFRPLNEKLAKLLENNKFLWKDEEFKRMFDRRELDGD